MRILFQFCSAAMTLAIAAPAMADDLDIRILYLERQVERPPILSNLDTPPKDLGLAGARLGLADNQTTGEFVGHEYSLDELIVPPGESLEEAATQAFDFGYDLIVANAPADDLLTLADMPGAENALILNAASTADRLRSGECRGNMLHLAPSRAMLTDSLAQFLSRKRWNDWLLIEGEGPGDAEYADALRGSAAKYNSKITEEKVWRFDADMRRNAAQEVPVFTQGEYDVVVVADEIGNWARYVLYNTWQARPIAGTEGLTPVAWSPVVEQWGAAQLQNRFHDLAGRGMRDADYGAWAAVRVIGEAVTRTESADAEILRAFMLSDDFELAAFKGRKATFRRWNGQMRQPIPLVHPRALVGQAPVEGFLHQYSEMDTLGLDEPETDCTAFDDLDVEAVLARLDAEQPEEAAAADETADAAGSTVSTAAVVLPARQSGTAAGQMYVSNEKDDTVSVIDIATLEVVRTIDVGERPRGIIFSKDYSVLYVCASDSDTVQVIDPDTGEVLHNLPSGEDPEQFALHPNNRLLYIANEDDAITTVVDTETRQVIEQIPVGIEPEGMAVSYDGTLAITTSETTNMAHWIDVEKQEIFANTLVDQRPRHAEFTAGDEHLWVSSEIGGTVTVFRVSDQKELAKIRFEVKGVRPDRVQPVGIRFSPDGKRAFVALGPSNHVAVVDTETFEVEKTILVGRRVWHMAFSPDGRYVFTTNGVSGDVTVIDAEKLTAIKTIKVGRFPWGAAARP